MPEYTDYPIEDILEAFKELTAKGDTLFQKWTCAGCGSRQTMEQPNLVFAHGTCEECGDITEIKACNYLLIRNLRS